MWAVWWICSYVALKVKVLSRSSGARSIVNDLSGPAFLKSVDYDYDLFETRTTQ